MRRFANISFGNYETTGRVPVDPINIDAIEITRGPNSNIFGLRNAAAMITSTSTNRWNPEGS